MRTVALALCIACTPPPATDSADPGPGDPSQLPPHPRGWQTEVFATHVPPVDVLFVLDTSQTMELGVPDLGALAAPLQQALDEHAPDYHVGLITTGMYSPETRGRLQGDGTHRWLTPATAPVADSLPLLLDQPRGTNLTEGRDSAREALGPLSIVGGYNHGFLRTQADLHLIFVSNSDDWSTGYDFPGFLAALKTPPWRVVVSGLAPNAQGAYRSLDVDQTGAWLDLIDAPWNGLWDPLIPTDPVSQGRLELAGTPDPLTLVVEQAVDGLWVALPSQDWNHDPASGAVILSAAVDWPLHGRYRVRYLLPEAP